MGLKNNYHVVHTKINNNKNNYLVRLNRNLIRKESDTYRFAEEYVDCLTMFPKRIRSQAQHYLRILYFYNKTKLRGKYDSIINSAPYECVGIACICLAHDVLNEEIPVRKIKQLVGSEWGGGKYYDIRINHINRVCGQIYSEQFHIPIEEVVPIFTEVYKPVSVIVTS